MKILALSCDKNDDLFYPFYHCIEKYWPDHPEVIYSTESKINPYYKTICKNYSINKWTRRIKETVEEIDDNFILIMVDDVFIQTKVDNKRVLSLINYFDDTVASLNLQPSGFDKKDIPFKNDIMQRSNNGEFKNSVMCSLWRKDKLISVLDYDTNPWQFEWDNKHKGYKYLITKNGDYLYWGFSNKQWRFGLHEGKWFRQCINFFKTENIDIDFNKRGALNMKPVFGIISYFPWDQPERKQRQDRLDRLVKQLSEYWPDIPIIFISQQWKHYNPEKLCKNKIIRFDYPKLGILNARQKLREHFLELDFDYLIMFDDDAIIEGTSELAAQYIQELNNHPQGFCFIRGKGSSPYTDYADSQLNLCAISRWIYEREPIPDIDPQKSQAFEDRIWSTLLHFKYTDYEFDAPEGLKCIHFKNPNEVAPSTWSGEKRYQWKQMREKTREIEKYISENKELPPWFHK